jgi:hypothetical protein
MILAENQALDCVYKDDAGGPPSHYIGRVTNVGANIGISGPGQMIWGVVAATKTVGPGALVGDYVGAQGSVAVGAGAGGAALVGGSNNTISLQPISVSVGTGLNVSAGLGNISLQNMPVTPPPPFSGAGRHGKKG